MLSQRTIDEIINAVLSSFPDEKERREFYPSFIQTLIDDDVDLKVIKKCVDIDPVFDELIEEFE